MTITSKERRLYQQTILDRAKNPRHSGRVNPIDLSGKLENPYCGDRIEITLAVDETGSRINDLKFTGSGCALCLASADLMVETVQGKTIDEAREIIEHFHQVMLDRAKLDSTYPRLKAIEGVKRYPIKVKCVTLAWHTLKTAICDSFKDDFCP